MFRRKCKKFIKVISCLRTVWVLVKRFFEGELKRANRLYKRAVCREIQDHWKTVVDVEILIREEFHDVNKQMVDSSPQTVTGEKKNKDYVVFIDKEYELDWIVKNEMSEETTHCISCAMAVEALPSEYLGRKQRIVFKKLCGEAIVSALEGNYRKSRQLGNEALDYLKKRSEEWSRRWIVLFASFTFLASMFLWHWLCCALEVFPEHVWCGFLAVVGTYTAIITRSGALHLDAAAGWFLHLLEVAVKMVVAFLFGVVACFMLKTSVCPDVFRSLGACREGVVLLGFIVGWSERLIPSMIDNYERKVEKEN